MKICETRKQTITAIDVVNTIVKNIHFQLFVSFLMVRQVVEHGKCNKENKIVQIAVINVQPLFKRISLTLSKSFISTIVVFDK